MSDSASSAAPGAAQVHSQAAAGGRDASIAKLLYACGTLDVAALAKLTQVAQELAAEEARRAERPAR